MFLYMKCVCWKKLALWDITIRGLHTVTVTFVITTFQIQLLQQQQQQQQQQQLVLQQQQQQQQQQSQQNQLQSFGITTLGGVAPQEATLHTPATGDTTHILLHNADLSNLQSQIGNGSNGMSQLPQPVQGISAQQVLNPLGSVQVRIAPGDDVKVGTPIHQLAVNNVSQQNQIHVQQQHQQQQQRTIQHSQQGVTLRTLSQSQNVSGAGGNMAAGTNQQQLGLQTILSAGGSQTQAIKLLQQVANQVTQNNQQPQQQQGIAVQQTDNKAIITQLFDQNMPPTNTSFVSVQPIQQQQQQQQQQQKQQPIPIQITKAVPSQAKTRMAQPVPVTKSQLVNSVAKVPSPTKASPGTSNNIPMGAKTKTKRQPKAKQPAKIAPAPASTSASAITATSSAALLTQLLTQGEILFVCLVLNKMSRSWIRQVLEKWWFS